MVSNASAPGNRERPILLRAHRIVNAGGGDYAFTDLRKSDLGGVQSRQFRLFTPVRRDRMRLPTSLPEFAGLRHVANLSDSPVTVAAELGGHWSEHNLAAITHVAACNFRCSYCYVDYRHLAGRDAFTTKADGVVDEFVAIRRMTQDAGQQLSLLRVSGGEPLLAPSLVIEIYRAMAARGLLDSVVLKVESNLSALPYAWQQSGLRLSAVEREELRRVKVHTTLHQPPDSGAWPAIRDGIVLALELGFELFPAVGANDWTAEQLDMSFHELARISPGLPRRLAVRPFHLDYPALAERRRLPRPAESEAPSMVWEKILRRHTGVGYLDEPRHLVPLT